MPGFILLGGGGEFQKGQEPSDQFALQQAGGAAARVLIITSGPDSPQGVNWFRSLGASNPAAFSLAASGQPDLLAHLAGANLIYLTGENPGSLLAGLQNSNAGAALKAALARGAVVGGVAGGAQVLMEYIYEPVEGQIRPGLGLVPNAVFVPHFNGAGRKWVPAIRAALPQALLIGVDEKVAVIGQGNDWQVHGRGWITVYRQGKPFKYQGGQPFKLIS
jgi:cyanophycinase-like exopeptidase